MTPQLVLLSLVLWCGAVCCYGQSSSEELSLQSATTIAPMATTSIHNSPTTLPPGDGGGNLSVEAISLIAGIVTPILSLLLAGIVGTFSIIGVIVAIQTYKRHKETVPLKESTSLRNIATDDHTAAATANNTVLSPAVNVETAPVTAADHDHENVEEQAAVQRLVPKIQSDGVHSDRTVVTDDNFLDLLELLKEENARWRRLGIHLKVNIGVLDDIERKPREMTAENKFEKVLTLWMNNKENATWKFLKVALQKLNENRLADSLKYTGQVEMSIGQLMKLLEGVMPRWKRLALFLKVNTGAIIPEDLQCDECMTDMITHWMKGNEATIGEVVKAVREGLNNNRLADKIEEEFTAMDTT